MTETTAMILLHVLMGLCLAACAGLRAWLPLLILGTAGRLDLVPLNESFEFLASTPALILFSVATVVEIVGDKIPTVDHILDVLETFIKPIAAVLMMAAALTKIDPLWACVLGLVLAAPTSLGVHGLKALIRLKSSAFTLGLANPVLSVLEDMVTVITALIAVVVPILSAVVLLILLLYILLRRRRAKKSPELPPRAASW